MPGQEPDPNAEEQYQFIASDLKMASADALKECEYAVLVIGSPDTGAGEGGGGMFSSEPVPEDEKYLPISLQYRPYTADTARDPSLADEILSSFGDAL